MRPEIISTISTLLQIRKHLPTLLLRAVSTLRRRAQRSTWSIFLWWHRRGLRVDVKDKIWILRFILIVTFEDLDL